MKTAFSHWIKGNEQHGFGLRHRRFLIVTIFSGQLVKAVLSFRKPPVGLRSRHVITFPSPYRIPVQDQNNIEISSKKFIFELNYNGHARIITTACLITMICEGYKANQMIFGLVNRILHSEELRMLLTVLVRLFIPAKSAIMTKILKSWCVQKWM